MPVHVCQPGKAWPPVPEVVIVLVLISKTGQDGTQCPCHRTISLVVIDESCVIGRHAGVTVCSLQALWKGPQTSEPLRGNPRSLWGSATARPRSAPEGNLSYEGWGYITLPSAEWANREGLTSSNFSQSGWDGEKLSPCPESSSTHPAFHQQWLPSEAASPSTCTGMSAPRVPQFAGSFLWAV